jgi:type III pantothenate kinase
LPHLRRRGAEVRPVPELVLEGLVTLPAGQGPLAITLPPLRPA